MITWGPRHGPPHARRAAAEPWRSSVLPARALAEHELAAARTAQQASVARHDLTARQRDARDAAHREAVERVVAGARVEQAFVDRFGGRRVKEQQIGVA